MADNQQLSPTMLVVLVAIGSMTGGGLGSKVGPVDDNHIELKTEIAELRSSIMDCRVSILNLDQARENESYLFREELYRNEK